MIEKNPSIAGSGFLQEGCFSNVTEKTRSKLGKEFLGGRNPFTIPTSIQPTVERKWSLC